MEDKNTISFFRFEDLRVYHKSVDYGQWVIDNVAASHNEAQSRMLSSFCTSALDIALNIAEGSSRSKAGFEDYLKIAKTAIRECVIYTTLAGRMALLNEAQCEASRTSLMELTRMIGALISSLQRGSHGRNNAESEIVIEDPVGDMSY